jgi:hypothetical protein
MEETEEYRSPNIDFDIFIPEWITLTVWSFLEHRNPVSASNL